MNAKPSFLLLVLCCFALVPKTRDVELIHDDLDHHDMCPTWSEEGRCDEETDVICPKSCLIQTLLNQVLLDAVQGMEYYRMPVERDCFDDDRDNCPKFANDGDCLVSDQVRKSCPKSCRLCISEAKFSFGVKQEILPYDPLALAALINVRNTANYMRDTIMVDEVPTRKDCFNHDRDCSWRAGAGHCDNPRYLVDMELNCAPACRACHRLALRRRCRVSNKHDSVLENAQLNRFFEKLYSTKTKSNLDVHTLSKPGDNGKPWIVFINSFLTPQECEILIQVGHAIGFTQSTINDREEHGKNQNEHSAKESSWRTSETAWCDSICQQNNSVVDSLMNRISRLVGLPRKSMEPLQLLRYKPGQFYTNHHDYIEGQRHLPCGPRLMTFFLYLNTNDNGGGQTSFSDLGISISPSGGRAVIWPNVLDHNLEEIDIRTYHEAKPVKKGFKFAANIWFHLYDYETALQDGCT